MCHCVVSCMVVWVLTLLVFQFQRVSQDSVDCRARAKCSMQVLRLRLISNNLRDSTEQNVLFYVYSLK